MPKYALVGKNISHSQSPQIYRKLIGEDIQYDLLDYSNSADIPSAFDLLKTYDGINITAPYKKHFFSQVELTPNAQAVGALNCLKKSNGKILAENTDYFAVLDLLRDYLASGIKNIIILGDGVMARVTLEALKKLNVKAEQYSRKNTEEFEYIELTKHSRQLIINTCAREYLFKGKLSEDSVFWDYNYNNSNQRAALEDKIFRYVDGFELLNLQAQYAVAFWSAN